jgi:hypothetical protein
VEGVDVKVCWRWKYVQRKLGLLSEVRRMASWDW